MLNFRAERFMGEVAVPVIEFIAGVGNKLSKSVDAPNGGELLDICDGELAPIPFSCRSANCGICLLRVLEGQEFLEVPNEEESSLLTLLSRDVSHRLACRARVKSGVGLVRLRAVGNEPHIRTE